MYDLIGICDSMWLTYASIVKGETTMLNLNYLKKY